MARISIYIVDMSTLTFPKTGLLLLPQQPSTHIPSFSSYSQQMGTSFFPFLTPKSWSHPRLYSFLSRTTSKPSANAIGSTFKMYPESDPWPQLLLPLILIQAMLLSSLHCYKSILTSLPASSLASPQPPSSILDTASQKMPLKCKSDYVTLQPKVSLRAKAKILTKACKGSGPGSLSDVIPFPLLSLLSC